MASRQTPAMSIPRLRGFLPEELPTGICYCNHITAPQYLVLVLSNGMIVAVEAAKQGVTVEEDAVSGLMFADNLWEFYGNTRRIAETNREGTRVL